jgi:hypothetical protein
MPGDNEDPSKATLVPDPAKSWAIYDNLHEGKEAHYYRFSIAEGKRIYVSLFISPAAMDRGFEPTLVLMGPGLSIRGTVPEYVQFPREGGILVVEARRTTKATYEAFSPSAFYPVSSLDLNAPATGTYYIAVYEKSQGGQYGLAVGYIESFTFTEWILAPINLISIYRWTGQNLLQVFAPMATTMVLGLWVVLSKIIKKRKSVTLRIWTGLLASFLFMGTSATTLTQMATALTRAPLGAEIVVTIVLAALPAILGIVNLRLTLRDERELTLTRRACFIAIGGLAFLLWAGFLLGPATAIVTGLLPPKGNPRIRIGKALHDVRQ